jgi:hypothetical protein
MRIVTLGDQVLQHARRRKIIGRPDLAQILLRGVGRFRAGHAEACHQRLRIIQVMIADPCQRQIGQHHIPIGQLVEGHRILRRSDATTRRQHHAFRAPGGSRCIEDDRRIGSTARVDLAIDARHRFRIAGHDRFLLGDQLAETVEAAVVVIAQAAGLVVDDVPQLRQLLLHRQNLVDLLLVLHDRDRDIGVVQHIGHLGGDRVSVDRNRNGAERLRRKNGFVQARPVVAGNGDRIAALNAEFRQAERNRANLAQQIRPGPGLPDAHVLMPQCGMISPHARMMDQKLRKCIRSSVFRHQSQSSHSRLSRAGRRFPAVPSFSIRNQAGGPVKPCKSWRKR